MPISRRDVFKAIGAGSAVAAVPAAALAQAPAPAAAAPAPSATPRVYLFLNAREAPFIEAALQRLIPNEPEWPGAFEADVSVYIDRQLDGAFGQGARFYRSGPFQAGIPGQGYQLRYTPAELFRLGVERLSAVLGEPAFQDRPAADQNKILADLEAGRIDLSPVPAATFFSLLLQLATEGYFADPAYGGNKDMTSWRMIGFPGAYAAWALAVEDHGVQVDLPPVGIGNMPAHGHSHSHGHGGHGADHGHPPLPAAATKPQ